MMNDELREGKKVNYQNLETSDLEKVKPVYKTFKGWSTSTVGTNDFEKLPKEAKIYLKFIEKEINTPIQFVSTGSKRHETIKI